MGKTSSAVKKRYNNKAYDRIEIVVPKGQKDFIKAHAESQGESVNAFIQRAINQAIENDKEGIS
jgi:predicted HicB family RNase H-like nuclease